MDYTSECPTRTLAREAPNRRLRWDLDLLKEGETLLVPKELLTFRRAYQYVKGQQSALGRPLEIDRHPLGWIVYVGSEDSVSGKRYMPRPSDVDEPIDWGHLEKPPGATQWSWPLGNMRLGDVFWVWPEDMGIERVRKRCADFTSATKDLPLEKRVFFNVTMDETVKMIRVQRVMERNVGWKTVKYGIVRQRVKEA
jgi:hypothetical protein